VREAHRQLSSPRCLRIVRCSFFFFSLSLFFLALILLLCSDFFSLFLSVTGDDEWCSFVGTVAVTHTWRE
jgi:hypothetical protein